MTLARFAAAAVVSLVLFAGSTRTWEQKRFEEFEKGVADRVSLRSDGRIELAPRFEQVYDAPAAYLWALAQDSKGNLYAGGGPGARVFRIAPGGNASKFFETEALEIQALAVDRADNLYAATSPDSRIYKIDPSGKTALFVDPKVKYVWAMAFNSAGDLFLATGDKGEVLRVNPSGRAQPFFKTDEWHIRSLLVEPNNDLVLGTDPGGLIVRVPASGGGGFVLHQSGKKEITAVVRGSDGTLYAAGVGTRSQTQAPALPFSLPLPASPAPVPSPLGQTLQPGPAAALPPPPVLPARPSISGGSEVFRIAPDGAPRRLWTSPDHIAYSLGFGADGKLIVGTGNQGRIFRLESDHVYSLLVKAAPSQITALLPGPAGRLWAATGNVGKIYRLGPELETAGTFESDLFDAGLFSRWGRLGWKGAAPDGAALQVETRSGNLGAPAQYWSPWSKGIASPNGAQVESPAARFFQWRAVLETRGAASPQLESVTLAYLPKNIAPTIVELEITPANHKFPDPPALVPSKSLTLPPLGSRPGPRTPPFTIQPSRSMTPAKGSLGARWLAQDDNEDELVYKAEIRGRGEQTWKLLKDKLEEPLLSWDSTAFADGVYHLRVTASDSPSNPGPDALAYSKISDPFTIDNTPPAITALEARADGSSLRVRFQAADASGRLDHAEYAVDGAEWRVTLPVSRLFDSRDLAWDFLTDPVPGGEHTVAIRVWDANENLATAKIVVK